MKKTLQYFCCLVFALSGFCAATEAEGAAAEWRDAPDGFSYTSQTLSCRINKDGTVRNIKTPKAVVFGSNLIHAAPVITNGEKYDSRIFQSRTCSSIKVKAGEKEEHDLILKGKLGNARNPEIAEYTETIKLTPAKISFSYEITLKDKLSLKSYNPFHSLIYAPCSVMKGLGYVTVDGKDKQQFCQFNNTYSKANPLRKGDIKKLQIVLPEGHVIYNVGKGAALSMSDTRAWGGKNFRINIKPNIPWNAKPINYSAGEKFVWSYAIEYKDL